MTVALTLSGNEITDAVRATATQGDGRKPESSMGIWEGTTNLALRSADLSVSPWEGSNASSTAPAIDAASPFTGVDYASAVLTDSPAAYWRLGEASGTVVTDSSGNNIVGVYNLSPVTLGTPSLITDPNTSVSFSGASVPQPIYWADPPSWWTYSAISMEAWIRPDVVPTTSGSGWHLVMIWNTAILYMEGGASPKFTLALWDNGSSSYTSHTNSTTTVAVDTTYHVVATYDGANVRMYVNGVLERTVASTVSLYDSSSGGGIASGGWGTLPSPAFDGRLDEIAIYGSTLSGTRVQAHYTTAVRRGVSNEITITNGPAHNWRLSNIAVTANTKYTFSFWARRGTATDVVVSIYDVSNANTIYNASYYSQLSTSKFVRIVVSFTTPAGCTSIHVYPTRDGGATGTVFVTGVQVEQKSIATPYVNTAGSSVTRTLSNVEHPTSVIGSTGWAALRARINWNDADDIYAGNNIAMWSWADAGVSPGKYIWIRRSPSAGNWAAQITNGTTLITATAGSGNALTRGDIVTLIVRWVSNSTIGISVNGAAFSDETMTYATPSFSGPARIGSINFTPDARQADSDVHWFACGTGTLSDANAATIHGFREVDKLPKLFPGDCKLVWKGNTNEAILDTDPLADVSWLGA